MLSQAARRCSRRSDRPHYQANRSEITGVEPCSLCRPFRTALGRRATRVASWPLMQAGPGPLRTPVRSPQQPFDAQGRGEVELLDGQIFNTLQEAKVVIASW